MKSVNPKLNSLVLLIILVAGFLIGAIIIGLLSPVLAKSFDDMTGGILSTAIAGVVGLAVIYGLLEIWGRYIKTSGKNKE